MKFIDYHILKEFYTIAETCELFGMEKRALQEKCNLHNVNPTRNEIGEFGFTRYDVRRLHNKLYYENIDSAKEADPWA